MFPVPAPIFNITPGGQVRIVGFTRQEELTGYTRDAIVVEVVFPYFIPFWATSGTAAWVDKFKLAAIMQSQTRRLWAFLTMRRKDGMPDLDVHVGQTWLLDGGIRDQLGNMIPVEIGDGGVIIGIEQVHGSALTAEDWLVVPAPVPGLPIRHWEVTFLRETPKYGPGPHVGQPIPHALHARFQNPDNDGRLNSIDNGELIVTVLPALPVTRTLRAVFPWSTPQLKG